MILASARTPLAVLIAVLLALAGLTACHDDIPTAVGGVGGVGALDAGVEQAASFSISHQERQQGALNYGVTEQDNVPWPTSYHASYSVVDGETAYSFVSLQLHCWDQREMYIDGLRPSTDLSRATLLILLDDLPVQTEDVLLQRFELYGPDGPEPRTSIPLDGPAWYERLRERTTLTVQLLGSDQDPVTFDLSSLFGTPLQDEFDNCADATLSNRFAQTRETRLLVDPSR